MSPPVRFGLSVPQGDLPPATLRAIAGTAEREGFHSLWVYDHLEDYPSPEQPAVLECFALLGLLAGWTERIRLGSLVLCDGYRNPALTAKAAATLDVLSGGRVEFGYGAGWHESETRAYGYEFPPPAVRIARMEEGLTIIRGLWTGEPTTFAGAHHRVDAAKCLPPPVQRPHPPITIGGGGEKLLLRAVARHADAWNYYPSPLPEYEQLLCDRNVDFVIAYDAYARSRHTNEIAVLRRLAATPAARVRLHPVQHARDHIVYAVDRARC